MANTLLCNDCLNVYPAETALPCGKCDSTNIMWVGAEYLEKLNKEIEARTRQIDFEKLNPMGGDDEEENEEGEEGEEDHEDENEEGSEEEEGEEDGGEEDRNEDGHEGGKEAA